MFKERLQRTYAGPLRRNLWISYIIQFVKLQWGKRYDKVKIYQRIKRTKK